MTLIEGEDIVLFTMAAIIDPNITRRPGDFMATVWLHDGHLQAEFRYRWYNTVHKLDMDGGADDDEKSFYTIGPVPDSAANREKMFRTFEEMPSRVPGFVRPWSERGEWSVGQFTGEVLMRSPMNVQLTKGTPS